MLPELASTHTSSYAIESNRLLGGIEGEELVRILERFVQEKSILLRRERMYIKYEHVCYE